MLKNYIDVLKRHGAFSWSEWKDLAIVSLLFAFVVSFDDWGIGKADVSIGLANFLLALMCSIVALLIHHWAQRLEALRNGVKVTQIISWPWVGISLLVAFASRGAFPVLAATKTELEDLPLHRIGHYRYRSSTARKAFIVLAGPIANALAAMVSIALFGDRAETFASVNLMMAIQNILPLPPLDGSRVFYYWRGFAAVVLGAFIGFAVTFGATGGFGWIGLLAAIAVATLFGYGWHEMFED